MSVTKMEVPALSVVIVDTRGKSSSSLEGYKELSCTQKFFDKHFLFHPKVKCVKSKVAELCGIEMSVYFHQHTPGRVRSLDAPPLKPKNTAATLLLFDPRTGHPQHDIYGKAYVVSSGGDYPLSNKQVWGVQELISEARDVYKHHPKRGRQGLKDLFTWCKAYRKCEYGPPEIYVPRKAKEYRCWSFDQSSVSSRSNDENVDSGNKLGSSRRKQLRSSLKKGVQNQGKSKFKVRFI